MKNLAMEHADPTNPAGKTFGIRYAETVEAAQVTGNTGTTATLSITWGPDSDTDPPDSD